MKNPRVAILAMICVVTARVSCAQPSPPTVSTLPASAVGATNATLNGVGNPSDFLTFGFFQWGTTTNYGNVTTNQSLGNGGSNTNFSQVVRGLVAGVTYHFRAVVSNSFDFVPGTNQTFATEFTLQAVTTIAIEPLITFGGGDGWLSPGEGGYAYLGTANNERGLAYGNGHLYLVSRSGGDFIRILDPLTGADLGALDTTGITGGTFAVNNIAVGGDGVVYVGNLTTQSSTTPYKVYRWATEASAPTVAYSGDAGLAGARIGDNLAAFGSGTLTRLAAGFGNTPVVAGNNGYAIINPTAGTATAVGFGTPPNAGDFRLGITFTDSSHVLGTQGGPGAFSRFTVFSGAGGTLLTSLVIPDPAGAAADRLFACAVFGGVRLLAVQSIGDSHVSVYDALNPGILVHLGSRNNTSGVLTANGNGTGQLAWGDIVGKTAKLYAMSSNQGIQAFLVTVNTGPALSATRLSDKIVLSWPTNSSGFGLESSTNLGASASWTAVSPSPVVLNTNYLVTNSIIGNAKLYRLKR